MVKLNKITVLSKELFKSNVIDTGVVKDPRKAFISILDPVTTPVLQADTENYKSFWFYDVEYEIGNIKPPSLEILKSIITFVEQNLDKEEIIVHCSAGVSRSGAVGEFIFDYFIEDKKKYPYQQFKKQNPKIVPNLYIKQNLTKLYYE